MVCMKMKSIAFGLIASALLAGCSGGGAPGGSTPITPNPQPTGSTSPVTPGSVLATANLDGGPAFVTAKNFAVYVLPSDGNDRSTCTGGCASEWPAVAPPTGTLPSPWSSFTGTNGSPQLAYNGNPLYTFVGDTKPLEATGVGVQGFELARPSASGTPTPDPTSAPTSKPTSTPYP